MTKATYSRSPWTNGDPRKVSVSPTSRCFCLRAELQALPCGLLVSGHFSVGSHTEQSLLRLCVGSETTVLTEGTQCLCLAEQTPAGHLTERLTNSGRMSLPEPPDLAFSFSLKSLPQIQHIEHILRVPGNTPPS